MEAVGQEATKKTKLMLTNLERVIFDRCSETGDTAEQALQRDRVLHRQIVDFATKEVRQERVNARLENDNSWLKVQVSKLKAGVREPQDEPNALDDIAQNQAVAAQEESRGG